MSEIVTRRMSCSSKRAVKEAKNIDPETLYAEGWDSFFLHPVEGSHHEA